MRRVTCNNGRGAKAQSRQEHFHLFASGVLSLVENNERVVERAATHEGKWCNFDDISLDVFTHRLKPEHFIECVVKRAKIRVDLLRQIAG